MRSNITVLHIIEALGPGGAERRLINDVRYLDNKRVRSLICCLSPNSGMWDRAISGIPVHVYDGKSISGLLKSWVSLNRIIRTQHVDIIHTQLFWADLLGRLCKLSNRNIKLISTVQSTAHENNDPYLYSWKRKVLDGSTARIFNDGFIAVSQRVGNMCLKQLKFDENKLKVIHNGVDIADFSAAADREKLRKEFGVGLLDPVLIYVGRLDPPKGHGYLLDALRQLKGSFGGIKLLVVGEGPSRGSLVDAAARKGLAGDVIFTGVRRDIPELLSSADIFVFPTLSEGMPLALLEAMAAGKPCVATDIGPNREVIRHKENGLLVRARDPEEIVSAVRCLFGDPGLMKALGNEAAVSVGKSFCAKTLAGELEEYYFQVLVPEDKI